MAKGKSGGLDYVRLSEDSRRFRGFPGLVSFAVARALRAAGASELEIGRVVQAMKDYFPKLSNEECEVLSRVLRDRLGAGPGEGPAQRARRRPRPKP